MTKEFKVGDYVQINHYALIEESNSHQTVLKDIKSGLRFKISTSEDAYDLILSSSEFNNEEKVCRTTLSEKLVHSNGHVFTATFRKKGGERRDLVGYFLYLDKMMGRSHVFDMENCGERQVDHRTIESLIINNVKYTLK